MHVSVTVTAAAQVPDKQLERRKRAVEALAGHSREVMEQLRDAEDELLAGGWEAGSHWLRCARASGSAGLCIGMHSSEAAAVRPCVCSWKRAAKRPPLAVFVGHKRSRQQHQRQLDALQLLLSELDLNSCQLVGLQGGSPKLC